MAWQRYASRTLRNRLLPAFIYAGLMAIVLRRRRPGFARFFAVVGVVLLMAVGACQFSEGVSRIIWPGSHRYIDDYVYLTGLDWGIPRIQQGNTVIAYEKQAWGGEKRIVGFMDGGVMFLPEDKFRSALAAQGRTLQPPPPE